MTREDVSEFLITIVASVVLCAGGVYFWHHFKTEWVEDHPTKPVVDQPKRAVEFALSDFTEPSGHLHHRLELSKWTPEDTKQFKECVKEHLLDWKHHAFGSRALLQQFGDIVSGKVCSSKVPPIDKSLRIQLLGSSNFLTREECNQLRTKRKPMVVSPDWKSTEQAPTALPTCIFSLSELRDWDDLVKQHPLLDH